MVRYEDLVKSPEVETKRLCNWLNLDWSETLLTPELIQHDIEVGLNKGFSGIWYDKDKLYQKITTKNVWAWEEKLTDFSKAVLYLTYCENKMLSNFNYTFSNKGLSKATILTASIYLNAIRIFQKTTILILNKLYTYAKKNNRLKTLILNSLHNGRTG